MDYCLLFVLFLKTISLSVLGSIFGIFKLFLHTIHLIIYTICIDKWKEKQKVTNSIFPTTIRYTTIFPSLLFIHCITPRFGRSIWISTVVAIFSYFFISMTMWFRFCLFLTDNTRCCFSYLSFVIDTTFHVFTVT